MGAEYCKSCDIAKQHQQTYDPLSKSSFLTEYKEDSWPIDDPILNSLLNLSTIYNKNLGIRPLKHKIFNRWFWGTWKDATPYGNGILYTVGDSSVYYEGEFQGGPKGFGRVVFNGGEWEYNGLVSGGRANGKGEIFNRKHKFKFDGQWKQSMPYKGQLTLFGLVGSEALKASSRQSTTMGDITIKLDHSKPGNTAQILYPDGKVYIGEIDQQKFLPHGRGEIVYPNESRYKGQWRDGLMHGHGRFEWADGSCYEGDYVQGRKEGCGVFCYPSENYYNGHWKAGKQEGNGIIYDKHRNEIKNGRWQAGTFLN